MAATQATKKALVRDSSKAYLSPSDIQERDIDLLLLEELHSSPGFQQHFVKLLAKADKPTDRSRFPNNAEYMRGEHSVARPSGQSDLEVAFKGTDGCRWRVLIENKIDAAFQQQQDGRYRERGTTYKREGKCDEFLLVVIAPQKYLDGVEELKLAFDAAIAYEDVRVWFAASQGLGRRAECKCGMLDAAIDKLERKAEAANERITRFCREYYQLVEGLGLQDELCMTPPKPARAAFIFFCPSSVPKGIDLVHKANLGHVDLQFRGLGDRWKQLQALFHPYLLPTMQIQKANKAAVIRCEVPRLDIEADVATQKADVETCVNTIRKTLQWWNEHRARFASMMGKANAE